MFDVIISETAEFDVRRNAKWWADNRSVDQSERWYVGILAKIESLSEVPQGCPVVRNSEQLGREVRQVLYGVSAKPTHRIYFGIEAKQVIVFRVLGIAQQLPDKPTDLG